MSGLEHGPRGASTWRPARSGRLSVPCAAETCTYEVGWFRAIFITWHSGFMVCGLPAVSLAPRTIRIKTVAHSIIAVFLVLHREFQSWCVFCVFRQGWLGVGGCRPIDQRQRSRYSACSLWDDYG